MKLLLWLASAGGLAFQHACNAATSPAVNAWLRSSWNASNYLAEVLETAVLEDPDAFFPLLDALVDPALSIAFEPPQTIYETAISKLKSENLLQESGALQSFQKLLALRAASPKLEAFHSYYDQEHENEEEKIGCGSWVEYDGNRLCNPDRLVETLGYTCRVWSTSRGHRLCLTELSKKEDETNAPPPYRPLPFDHVYPATAIPGPQKAAVLYASLTSSNFYSLHAALLLLVDTPDSGVRYVFRHKPDLGAQYDKPYLSGYGVALDLKKTDYLALDDRRSKGMKSTGSSQQVVLDDAVDEVEDPILSMFPDVQDTPSGALTEEEMKDMGLKASQLVMTSKNPLQALTKLTQNFPKYATALARKFRTNNEITSSISMNARRISSGGNMVWVNGKGIPATDMNPFALLRILRKERKLMSQLTEVGLTRAQAFELLTHPELVKNPADSPLQGLFDASDRSEGSGVITYLNDMEKDEKYASFPQELHGLLQPSWGGRMPTIRRNVHNVILVLDLTKAASMAHLSMAAGIIDRSYPIRFGVVPLVETEEAAMVAQIFHSFSKIFGPMEAVGIFGQAMDRKRSVIDLQGLEIVYNRVTSVERPKEGETWQTFAELTSTTDFDYIDGVKKYATRLALTIEGSVGGYAFVNGRYMVIDDEFVQGLQTHIGQHMQIVQNAVYQGGIRDIPGFDVSTWFYDLPSSAKSRNPYVYPAEGGPLALRIVPLVDLKLPKHFIYEMPTIHSMPSTPISVWLVGDFESEGTVTLLKEALTVLNGGTAFRLSLLPLASPGREKPPSIGLTLFGALFSDYDVPAEKFLELLQATIEGVEPASHVVDDVMEPEKYAMLESAGAEAAQKIGLAPGDVGLVVNGRVIGPIPAGALKAADIDTLIAYEREERLVPVHKALVEVLNPEGSLDFRIDDTMLAKVTSIVMADQLPDPTQDNAFSSRVRPYSQLRAENASFTYGNEETAIYRFGVILNPLSDNAQRYSSLLEWLAEDELVHIVVYFNPSLEISQMPLKRFYRYNLLKAPTFKNQSPADEKVEFTDLPIEPIYTLAMDVPQAWLVRPSESLHDLDNIQLSTLHGEEFKTGVEALFSLDYLVVEGHARDELSKAPPRGLQVQLTSGPTPISDTQVVANLGYFQLKARPGVFQLEIRPGRGRDIYNIVSVGNEGWNTPSRKDAANVIVTSFEGITLWPVFNRNEGMEAADVLASDEEEASLFGNIANKVGSIFSKPSTDVVKGQADINIFTVASGLLYERFASIMILSVMKNTKHTVKFWFIENFLSPSFLEFIPHYAEEYGFEYELVTYKWPSWLRMPTEKQRIIWGYKILFLDVLFPMDLKKVIFVDADQIVRTDLHELVTLDLQGAPYGYTPMGDDSEDMDGFRFWKTGYWKEHLAGRPYHISALYVVDLVRFRQIAAGDRLRGQYQALSADPNSLSNLDQDLPNNMQKEVPIFSLPEDWLWCETWCSKNRLHRAKTIDLCQNPKTKEPKLSRARQIPEWEQYDSEIATFARKLSDEGKIRSAAAAENVDALAGEATSKPKEEETASGEAKAHDEL